MFDTRKGNYVFFAALTLLIAVALMTLRNEFPPEGELEQIDGQVLGVRFRDSGSGSIDVTSHGTDKRLQFVWDIKDVFAEVEPNDSVELLTDDGWVVSVNHQDRPALAYNEYIFRRSKTVLVIVAFAGLTMLVNLVAYTVRLLGFGPAFGNREHAASG